MAEIDDDFVYGKKNGKMKQSMERRSEDDEDNDHSGCSSSEGHEKGVSKGALVDGEKGDGANEAERNEGKRKQRYEGWPACHSGRGFYGMGGPEHMAELLEAFSKQGLKVAVLVGGIGV